MKQELSVLYKLFVHHHPSLSSRVEEERVKTSFCQRNFSVGRAERRIEWKTRAYFSQGPSRLVPPENARARTPRIFSSTFHLSRSADCAQRCIGYHRMGALRWKMWASLSFFLWVCARREHTREKRIRRMCFSHFCVVVVPRTSLPTRRSTTPARLPALRSTLVGPPAL